MPSPETTLQQERYRIVHLFDSNEKGSVYEAYDNVLKTNVVLKEIRENGQKTNDVQLLTGIKHESISSVSNYFSEINNHYLVMELNEGVSVFETINRTQKPFSFLETLQWADQLLDALHYLHTQKPPIIHRHITPQNIKLLPKGKVKLLFAGDDAALSEILGGKITNFSGFDLEAVNLSYTPLELLWENLDPASRKVILNSYDENAVANLEKPIDARSDVYAIGANIYYMLTGQHPADALSRSISILESDSDSLQAPHLLNHSIPTEVSSVIMRSMEINRENRFSSAVIMRQILRTAFVKTNHAENPAENSAENSGAEPTEENQYAAETKAPAEFAEERRLFEENRLKLEAEQKRLEADRLLMQQKKEEFEAAQRREAAAAEEKIRQSEIKRLEAEQRAAEAEKKLLAKQKIFNGDDDDLFELDVLETNFEEPANQKSSGAEAAKASAEKNSRAAEEITAEEITADEPPEISRAAPALKTESAPETELFAAAAATAPKNNSFRAAAAVLALIVFGAAGWAVWNFTSAKSSAQTEPAATTQTSVANDAAVPKTTVESNAPAQEPPPPASSPNVAETTPTNPEAETSAAPAKTGEIINNQPASRNKFVPAQIKKPSAPPKPVNSPKKAVTVDDLISDN